MTPEALMERVQFTVYGVAEPKGSTTSRFVPGRGRTFTRHPQKTKAWEALVKEVAQAHVPPGGIFEGPVAVGLCFYRLRPQSAPKRKRTWPITKPDIDKLERAVLDGLQGVIYAQDSQVVAVAKTKDFGNPPRVEITVLPIQAEVRALIVMVARASALESDGLPLLEAGGVSNG